MNYDSDESFRVCPDGVEEFAICTLACRHPDETEGQRAACSCLNCFVERLKKGGAFKNSVKPLVVSIDFVVQRLLNNQRGKTAGSEKSLCLTFE